MKDANRLTLEEKIGQLFFLGFHGPEPDRETRVLLDAIRPGGIVLSQRNIESFDQTCRLTTRLTEIRDTPALVAVHQEGGAADRLKSIFAPLPSVHDAANGGTLQLRQVAWIIGAELAAAGFNTLFGPVLDLGTPGSFLRDRTLAATPGSTMRLGKAFIEEVGEHGIAVCGKHFPGLGAAKLDPHFSLPRIEKQKKLLLMEDVPPFENLFGILPMLMVGHAAYPELDPDSRPASLSPRIVDGLLRKKLRYSGVVVTDDMTMGAITGLGLTPERFLEAFEAGNDMLLFSQTTPLVGEAFHTLLRAAKKSAALRARVDASVERILALKLRQASNERVQNRAYLRTRILRHIEKLGRGAVVPGKLPQESVLRTT